MSLKDFFQKILKKSNENEVEMNKNTKIPSLPSDAFPVFKVSNEQLASYQKIPFTAIASLGQVFSQIPESARTITQSVTKNIATNETLFVGFNPKNIQGVLQQDTFGFNGNIMQINAQGKQVIAGRLRFKPVNNLPITETTKTILPPDPMLMVVAVVLITIEQKLDGIQKSVEEVLQFLKQEKQSRQRGNLNMLMEIIEDYKLNCQNEQFCTSRTSEVLSIKTMAYQDIDFYQNQISSELQKQKAFHGSKDAQSILDAVTYQFAEYQLACYLFAFSSFLDILLQKTFDTSAIANISNKLTAMIQRYEALYLDCYDQVSKYQHSAIGAKVLDGIGAVSKALGTTMKSIPMIKDAPIGETLITTGDSISKHNQEIIEGKLQEFTKLKNNQMLPFIKNLKSLEFLYNTENAIITDGENLYILQAA